jgi:hypothetical protein
MSLSGALRRSMYTRAMRRKPTAIAVVVCFSLFVLQLSGLHLHVNAAADGPATHGTHVHGSDMDGHDHEGDKDVSVVELGAGASKHLVFLFALSPSSAVLPRPAGRIAANLPTPVRAGRRSRWRPPLRAPPAALPVTSP